MRHCLAQASGVWLGAVPAVAPAGHNWNKNELNRSGGDRAAADRRAGARAGARESLRSGQSPQTLEYSKTPLLFVTVLPTTIRRAIQPKPPPAAVAHNPRLQRSQQAVLNRCVI